MVRAHLPEASRTTHYSVPRARTRKFEHVGKAQKVLTDAREATAHAQAKLDACVAGQPLPEPRVNATQPWEKTEIEAMHRFLNKASGTPISVQDILNLSGRDFDNGQLRNGTCPLEVTYLDPRVAKRAQSLRPRRC